MFDHLGKFVSRRWAWVLAAWVLLVVVLKLTAPPWASISQDDDIKSFPADFDSVRGYSLLEKAFPNDVFNSQVVVVVERRDGELSEMDFQFVDALAARLTRVQEQGERRDADRKLVADKYALHEFITHNSADKGKLLVSADKRATLLYSGCDHTFLAEKVKGTVKALRDEVDVMRQKTLADNRLAVAVAPGNDGTGVIGALPLTNLAGGNDTPPVMASLTTTLAGLNNDLTFTARATGLAGNDFRIRFAVAGSNTPLSLSINDETEITINIATNGSGAPTSTANDVLKLSQCEVPAGIQVAVTGSAGVGADIQFATDESLHRSFLTTIGLVIVILLLVYRSPIVAFIPLVTIAVSVVTSMSLMSLLTLIHVGNFRFQVLKITTIFVIVVLFGAGTDYCLFLIARYREELELGNDRESSLRLAIRHVGGALAASAATVVVGLGMMVFADFGKFRCTGPAVAISLAVALVGSLTLTPALLRLLGPVVFWPFKIRVVAEAKLESSGHGEESRFTRRFWDNMSHFITRRPALIWATSVLFMVPFAVWGYRLIPTYDFLSELDPAAESKVGSALIERDGHFPKGSLGTLTIMLQTGRDLRERECRKDIAELTERIRQGGAETGQHYSSDLIAQVRSLTSPLGEPLPPESEKPAGKAAGGFGQFIQGASDVQAGALRIAYEKATKHYASSETDGHVMRLDVVFNVAPFSRESMQLRDGIDRLVGEFTDEPETTLSGASHVFAGITSSTYDLMKITQSDQKRINIMVVIAVYMILVVLLRQPGVCLYLMFTVLFSYYATLGMTEGVFRVWHEWHHPGLPWLGLDWKVAFFLFIILVAVGEDYNILLMSRVVEEERKRGVAEGVRVAVARTGGIITSCGIIMAGTFGSMATGTLAAIIQLGFSLALGVLLDTFVVRPVLVPAFLLMLHSVRQRWQSPRTAPPRPHIAGQPPAPAETEPVGAAQRRGLLALMLAWFGKSL